MSHPLDNPVWHALVGPHSMQSVGRGLARHYPRDVAPFSAIAEPTAAAYADLAADLPPGVEARLFRPSEEPTLAGWETISVRPIIQMVMDESSLRRSRLSDRLVDLETSDTDAMLELAEITKPGPFYRRTGELGHYVGLRENDRLLAMGGERFRLTGFVELSAICVHPDARGARLGATIVSHLAHMAHMRGEIPLLHVFPENPAVHLYAQLGFRERARLLVIWRRPHASEAASGFP